MNTTFASMYNPNINLCGQCHNTRGARWDGLAYGLITSNVVSGFVTNIYAQEVYSNSYTYTTNQYGAVYTLTNVYDLGRIQVTNVLANVTNPVVTVGLTTNVTGFSRAPHNSVQYNILIGILQPDYLNTTNGKTVYTNGIVNNGMGIYATHSGIVARNPVNTNQCSTCHVPSYTSASGAAVTGHTFEMDTHNCTICHGSVPTWAVTQATTTNSIRNLVMLLNQWANDKAPAILGSAYNTSLQNSWEYTTPGVLASVTNAGPSSANQLKLPAVIQQARFNTYMVRNDGSLGVHNPTFIPLLLSDAETKVLSQYPVAAFSAKTVIGAPSLKVVFTNLVSGLSSYSWDFGDGHASTIANPTNTYASIGTYTVTFTGVSGDGLTTESLVRSNYITVAGLPVASFTVDNSSGTRPFTVNASSTSTGAVSYRWQIYTNATASYYVSDVTATSVTYGANLAAGSYKILLRASNAAGSTTATNTITVN
jgi:PKD repeat protein